MLAEKELEQAAAQLAEFRAATDRQHETLSQVLKSYTALMEDYKRLKSDYEEERDSRERYKQMAKGQERNPFVLVLIDGDGKSGFEQSSLIDMQPSKIDETSAYHYLRLRIR